MSRNLAQPIFGVPPREYDPRYMADLVRAFAVFQQQTQNPGEGRHTGMVLTNLPTSPTGLESGTVYVDGSGFLKVVP